MLTNGGKFSLPLAPGHSLLQTFFLRVAGYNINNIHRGIHILMLFGLKPFSCSEYGYLFLKVNKKTQHVAYLEPFLFSIAVTLEPP